VVDRYPVFRLIGTHHCGANNLVLQQRITSQ